MLVKPNDDQQYGVITKILKQGKPTEVGFIQQVKDQIFMVQCYGKLSRKRKCSPDMCTFPKGTSLSVDDTVLVEFQDKKTGAVAYVYTRSEKCELIERADELDVPLELVEILQEEGYDIEPDVTFQDDKKEE